MTEPTTPPVSLSRARVLVVDDHPGTAATLARALSQLGPAIEVISATSARSALDQVRDGAVDLLITDMMMPEMNGLELIDRLKTHPGGHPTFTILITAYDVPGLKESARRLKVNEIIIKPFRPERIVEIVRKALEAMSNPPSADQLMPARQPYKILVADDIPDNVSLLARYLQNEGYSFITAPDGCEALNKTRSEMPDLILLDVNMPQKDGLEVLREIRADPTIEHIPVILLTAARVDPADMRAGLNLGADDYVTKPFDRRELLARIRTKLRAKEVEEAVRRRYNELSVLPEIGRDLSARLDIDDLTDVVLRRVVETLGAMSARLVIFDPQKPVDKEFHLQSSVISTPATEFPYLRQLMDQVRQSRQSVVINDLQRDPRWGVLPGYPMKSVIILPLVGRLDLVGLLVLIHEQAGYFVSGHQLLLQAIASQATIALEGAALHAKLMRAQLRAPDA